LQTLRPPLLKSLQSIQGEVFSFRRLLTVSIALLEMRLMILEARYAAADVGLEEMQPYLNELSTAIAEVVAELDFANASNPEMLAQMLAAASGSDVDDDF
jgi:hypothetical protein